jgi:hypothetical protein
MEMERNSVPMKATPIVEPESMYPETAVFKSTQSSRSSGPSTKLNRTQLLGFCTSNSKWGNNEAFSEFFPEGRDENSPG